MTKVKICGLRTAADADLVNQYKPDYAGMILTPGFRRSVSRETAGMLRERLDEEIPLVGVFVDSPPEDIRAFLEEGIIDIAQLHGQEDAGTIRTLKAQTGKPVWKAFQITEGSDWQAIEDSPADLVLLDAGKGSGQTFDWSLANRVKRPFLLAGGLTPDNVRRAVEQVHPFGVDVSSGVETEGSKDREKVRAFIMRTRIG